MDKDDLKQYRAIKGEIEMLNRDIEKLHRQADAVPTVMGKVQASGKDFPYVEEHIQVEISEPKEADLIAKRELIKQKRLVEMEKKAVEIEQFIAGIKDSKDRQIFEYVYLEGMTQSEVAEILSYDQSTVAYHIKKVLETQFQ